MGGPSGERKRRPKLDGLKAMVHEELVPTALGEPCSPGDTMGLVDRRAPPSCWLS